MKKNSVSGVIDLSTLNSIKQLANDVNDAKRAAQKERAAQERKTKLKEKCKQYSFLTVGTTVYVFPKTDVLPDNFTAKLTALGQNPADYKLAAVKPRNSNPIQVNDLRIAVRRGNVALVAQVKAGSMTTTPNANGEGYTVTGNFTGTRLAWPHLTAKSDTQFLQIVRKSDLGIWYE